MSKPTRQPTQQQMLAFAEFINRLAQRVASRHSKYGYDQPEEARPTPTTGTRSRRGSRRRKSAAA